MDARATRLARRLLGTFALLALLLAFGTPAIARAETSVGKTPTSEPSRSERAKDFGTKSFDVIILRPLQSAAVVGGSALFVPAAMMSSPGGMPLIEEAWDYFVVVRYEDAWTRPIGDF